jgi:autotransporter-associated beta strand protein
VLDLLGSQNVSLGGVISGTGGLVKNGAATLALNGANTFSGGVGLNAGVLQLGNARRWVPASWTWAATLRWMPQRRWRWATPSASPAPTSPCWAAMT